MSEEKRLIDFHTHILPGIDDGSKSPEESLAMLAALKEQGVSCIAATPHFYASSDSPERFLRRRQEAFFTLKSRLEDTNIQIFPGAEVYYYEGIDHMTELDEMKIAGTDCLLLEMPDGRWTQRMVGDILTLQGRPYTTVMLAHIERFADDQHPDTLHLLRQRGVLFQVNASFFLRNHSRRQALRMAAKGEIDAIGSDCHNMTTRAPNIGAAYAAIEKKCGAETVRALTERTGMLFHTTKQ